LGKHIHPIWPGEIRDIVFVVGCPRSGTSVFGHVLSRHPAFLYMHEPRYIWRQVNPHLNVWRDHPTRGRLYWDAEDVDARDSQRLARWFHLALTLGWRRRLVEKMPLNVFRLAWLAAAFPEAKFIHVIRHARDVALSLRAAVAQWFSAARGYPEGYWASSWHYGMFEEHAERIPALSQNLAAVQTRDDDYARSVFVWLCCVWEGRRAGRRIGADRYLELQYEQLIEDPAVELRRVFHFLEEEWEPTTIAYAGSQLHDRSIRKPDPDPDATRAIAGSVLLELGYEG
jgi:hypothetical protein